VPQNDSRLKLYLANRAALIDYAAPIVCDRLRAEDVVQEAYIRFVVGEKARDGAPIANPIGYLYRIVRNLALDWARRAAVELPLSDPGQVERLAAAQPSAEQSVLAREDLRRLAEALLELPERTRLAFNLHRLEGRTLEEVAARLDVSIVRAHQLVKAAILHCARRLDATDR
jgi:RNA polymerase sigma-70 factor (ECF subfamily)